MMKKPPSFIRFLLIMVFLLEGLTLAIVIGFLFAMLDQSMRQEQISRIHVQQAELRLYVTDRLNYTYTRVAEIGSNNNIKIALLLGMHSKITENMEGLYPQTRTNTYYVRSKEGRFFPQLEDRHDALYNSSLYSFQLDRLTQTAVNSHTYIYAVPVVQQNQIIGHIIGAYDFSTDSHCQKLLKAFKDLSLVYMQSGQWFDLLTNGPLPVPPHTATDQLTPQLYLHASQNPLTLHIGINEFPSLYYMVDNKQYLQDRRSMVIKLLVLCIPLLFLTFTFSFLILGSVKKALGSLAKDALHIAQTDGLSDLDTTKIRHAEFLNFALAFNKILATVQRQTVDLKSVNENLHEQIIKRQQTANALQESENHLRSLQNNIPIGLYRRSPDGRLLFANPKLVSTFGFDSEEEMMQTPIRQFYYDPNQYDQVVEQLKMSGKIQSLELQFKRKDGTVIWGAMHINQTTDPISGAVYIDGAVVDITDRKKIEHDKAKLETQLRQSRKMEALGTLSGGIAHDFNNILFAIIGFCELALEDAATDTSQQENLHSALAGARRAAELVQQILTFARQTDLEMHPLNLDLIVNESLKLMRATLPSSVEIKTKLHKNVTILSDLTQMHQVIFNICTNAYHAMRESGGKLTITLDKVDMAPGHVHWETGMEQGVYAWLRIDDTGCGIPDNILERIFDPYFTTKPQGEGSGMGLSVVQGIVRSLKGVICAESVIGEGSTFHIYLPVLEKMEQTDSTDPKQKDSIASGREHILLVDDESALTAMISQMLSKLGYHVTTFNCPLEALELFRHTPEQFDLVLSDVTMPQMAGHEMAGEMIKIRPDLPVILITGYSDSISGEKAASIGIRDLIHKPLGRHELLVTIRNILDNKSAA
jgi:PAS domain S-box-containing protein